MCYPTDSIAEIAWHRTPSGISFLTLQELPNIIDGISQGCPLWDLDEQPLVDIIILRAHAKHAVKHLPAVMKTYHTFAISLVSPTLLWV